MDFCELTKELWRLYFSSSAQENLQAVEMLDEQVIIVGTGGHEYYMNRADFARALTQEMQERGDISFRIKNFWCNAKEISPNACLTYGGIYAWWESGDQKITIDMDSRFTILYQKIADAWKVVHIHHSLPNREQLEGEYYPKTLTEQVKEAQAMADELAQLAQKDGLTGLVNYRTLEKIWGNWKAQNSWLFVLDLDDFKEINDTFGHMAGNHVLQDMAILLSGEVRAQDVVCRMGGDEFILLCGGLQDAQTADLLAQRILQRIAAEREAHDDWPGVSMGATLIREHEALESAIARADQALYMVKKTTKNGYRFA